MLSISKTLSIYLNKYNIYFWWDISTHLFMIFIRNHLWDSWVKIPCKWTYLLQQSQNPSCIDLILRNRPRHFYKLKIIETEIFDFHKTIKAVMKMHFPKAKSRILSYRSYKNFKNSRFNGYLRSAVNPQISLMGSLYSHQFGVYFTTDMQKQSPGGVFCKKSVFNNFAKFIGKHLTFFTQREMALFLFIVSYHWSTKILVPCK